MAPAPPPNGHRRNVRLDHDAEALVRRVGNVSEYLSRTIMRRSKQWTSALELLRVAEWTGPELLVACEALNGYWLAGGAAHGGYLATVLEDGLSKEDAKSKKWRARGRSLGKDPGLATALAVLVDEYWSGNAACQAAIRAA